MPCYPRAVGPAFAPKPERLSLVVTLVMRGCEQRCRRGASAAREQEKIAGKTRTSQPLRFRPPRRAA